MIHNVTMMSLVKQNIIEEEMNVEKICSCCNQHSSTLLIAQCRGIAVILEHICGGCYKELLNLICDEKELIKVAMLVK
jgi:hypothetical protein